MNDERLNRFLLDLSSQYPDFPVAVRPWSNEEDEAIEHFLFVLGVPADECRVVTRQALKIAFEVYADGRIPFRITAVTPETAAAYFAD